MDSAQDSVSDSVAGHDLDEHDEQTEDEEEREREQPTLWDSEQEGHDLHSLPGGTAGVICNDVVNKEGTPASCGSLLHEDRPWNRSQACVATCISLVGGFVIGQLINTWQCGCELLPLELWPWPAVPPTEVLLRPLEIKTRPIFTSVGGTAKETTPGGERCGESMTVKSA